MADTHGECVSREVFSLGDSPRLNGRASVPGSVVVPQYFHRGAQVSTQSHITKDLARPRFECL